MNLVSIKNLIFFIFSSGFLYFQFQAFKMSASADASQKGKLAEEYIKERKKASAVRVGDIIMIHGRACKVIAVSVSKTGKHGHAKVRIETEGDPNVDSTVKIFHSDIVFDVVEKGGGVETEGGSGVETKGGGGGVEKEDGLTSSSE